MPNALQKIILIIKIIIIILILRCKASSWARSVCSPTQKEPDSRRETFSSASMEKRSSWWWRSWCFLICSIDCWRSWSLWNASRNVKPGLLFQITGCTTQNSNNMMFLVKLIITNSSSRCLTWTMKMSVAWLRRLGLEWILKLRGSFQIQHHHRTISVSFLNRTSGKESIWISQSSWAGSTTPPSTFYHRHHYHHHYHHHQMDLNNMGCCKNKSSSPSSFSALEWI